MTTNVINKGWFNPISLSVLLILVIVSAVLYVSKIINIPVFILLLLLSTSQTVQYTTASTFTGTVSLVRVCSALNALTRTRWSI